MTYHQTPPLPNPVVAGCVLRDIQAYEETLHYLPGAEGDDLNVVQAIGFSVAAGYSLTLTAFGEGVSAMAPEQLDWFEFEGYRIGWMATRRRTSSFAREQMNNPDYIKIIGMGSRAISPILHRLQIELMVDEPDDWFTALWAITKENPVPAESQGKIFEAAEAWLNWGLREGYIYAGVGIPFP